MTINLENLDKLINHLKKISVRNFNMSGWLIGGEKWLTSPMRDLISEMETGKGTCGTVACIAGHAAMISRAETGVGFYRGGESMEAERWLGLTMEQADQLFTPDHAFLPNITLAEAIQALETLKETAEEGDPKIVWPENTYDAYDYYE